MNKRLFTILVMSVMVLGVVGCSREKIEINSTEANDYIISYIEKHKEYDNLAYNYVDNETGEVIVGLIDNSKEKQDEFIEKVYSECCGSKMVKAVKTQEIIKFQDSDPLKNLDSKNSKIVVEENSPTASSSFDIYLERDGITIYKVPNIKEIYYENGSTKVTMKDYISKTFQTTDDSIKYFTDLLENTETLKDGGTKIYKSKEYNITLVKCNTVDGNKNVFIGNYETKFDSENMCRK